MQAELFTFSEQVTDFLLDQGDLLVMDIASAVDGPALMVLAPNRMPVFLFLHRARNEETQLARKIYTDQMEDKRCAWFDVKSMGDLSVLLDAIQHLRKTGEIRAPRTAASEGFEATSDARKMTSWMD